VPARYDRRRGRAVDGGAQRDSRGSAPPGGGARPESERSAPTASRRPGRLRRGQTPVDEDDDARRIKKQHARISRPDRHPAAGVVTIAPGGTSGTGEGVAAGGASEP
jgi:hypothetical protein